MPKRALPCLFFATLLAAGHLAGCRSEEPPAPVIDPGLSDAVSEAVDRAAENSRAAAPASPDPAASQRESAPRAGIPVENNEPGAVEEGSSSSGKPEEVEIQAGSSADA